MGSIMARGTKPSLIHVNPSQERRFHPAVSQYGEFAHGGHRSAERPGCLSRANAWARHVAGYAASLARQWRGELIANFVVREFALGPYAGFAAGAALTSMLAEYSQTVAGVLSRASEDFDTCLGWLAEDQALNLWFRSKSPRETKRAIRNQVSHPRRSRRHAACAEGVAPGQVLSNRRCSALRVGSAPGHRRAIRPGAGRAPTG